MNNKIKSMVYYVLQIIIIFSLVYCGHAYYDNLFIIGATMVIAGIFINLSYRISPFNKK